MATEPDYSDAIIEIISHFLDISIKDNNDSLGLVLEDKEKIYA